MQERERKQAEAEAARQEQDKKEAWISDLIKSETPSWKRDLSSQLQQKRDPAPPPPPVAKPKQDVASSFPNSKPQVKLF